MANTLDDATSSALLLQHATKVPTSLLYNFSFAEILKPLAYVTDTLEAEQQMKMDRKPIILAAKSELPLQWRIGVAAVEVVSRSVTNADYMKHVKLANKLLGRANKVVIVSHSQGNLFANRLYDNISPPRRNRMTFIHVAPPGNEIRGKDYLLSNGIRIPAYHLSYGDKIINFVNAKLVMNGLKPNMKAPTNPAIEDLSGHGFAEVYMDSSSSSYHDIRAVVRSVRSSSPFLKGRDNLTGEYDWDTVAVYKNGQPFSQHGTVSFKDGQGTWETDNGKCSGTAEYRGGEFYSKVVRQGNCVRVNGEFRPSAGATYPDRFERDFNRIDSEISARDVMLGMDEVKGKMTLQCKP